MKIILSRNELLAAMLFASTEEGRYVLNSVCVEVKPKKQPNLISTDGRRLVVIETLATQDEEFTEPYQFVLSSECMRPVCALSKAIGGKNFAWVSIETKPGSKRVSIGLVAPGNFFLSCEERMLVEGTYPNWKQVIPRTRKGDRVPITDLGINSEFMGDFAKAAKLLESKTAVVQMSLGGDGKAIEVKLSGVENFYGCIMPCKADDSVEYQPEFVKIIEALPEPEPEPAVEAEVETPRVVSGKLAPGRPQAEEAEPANA